MKFRKNYCMNICNYFNNLKGYIEDFEIFNLLWCLFGIEKEDIIINETDTKELSNFVECDMQEEFYKYIVNRWCKYEN